MKNWMWSLFVFVITFLIAFVLNIPFWIFLIVVIPLLIIALTYGSFSYSFRAALHAEPIPEHGYESRIKDLDLEVKKVTSLGFEKFDAFYLKMIPDSIIYALTHKAEPIYLCLYHLGSKKTCDIFTRYENGFTLTTCDNVDGGMTPRPNKNLLEIITSVSYEKLFEGHQKAHKFLIDKGLRNYELTKDDFRNYFMKSIHDYSEHVRKYLFWPILLVIWTVRRHGRVYCKTIEMQYKEGRIKLHEK